MDMTFGICLGLLIVALCLATYVDFTRDLLKDHDTIIGVWMTMIGLLAALWFGFSADQLAETSKTISENSYYSFTIESDEDKDDDYIEYTLKSGMHRSLYLLLKSQDFSSEEPIRLGMNENRENAESISSDNYRVSIRNDKFTKADFFLTDSFYYYFVVGEGLNGDVQVNTIVFLNDNLDKGETINKNSEFFVDMSKQDLINKKTIANMYAREYLDEKGEENTKENVARIAHEFNTILNKYEEVLYRVKEVY